MDTKEKEQAKKETIEVAINREIRSYVRKIDKAASKEKEKMTYADFLKDRRLIIKMIRKGMPYSLFHKIRKTTPLSKEEWAEYLSLSTKTLQRHQKDPKYLFKPIYTEKIIELAEVISFGKEVFGSTAKFYAWLNTPSFALGNQKPIELSKTSYGKELVMDELNRIDHGIFA